MGPHLHIHVQIAGTAALGAGSALPRPPSAIAAVNTRRYADFYGSGFMHLATAAAVAARILDSLAGAAAGRAGLLHGKEALLHAHLALSGTGGTDAQATILCHAAAAGVAVAPGGKANVLVHARHGIFKVELELVAQVLPTA